MPSNHHTLIATKCGHWIHPSGSDHTPYCSRCVVDGSKARVSAAAGLLWLHGGIDAPDHMRTQQWNRARLQFEIAQRRLDETRTREIRRLQREQAWDVAHRRGGLRHMQAGASSDDCIVCQSMRLSISIAVAPVQIKRTVPWWEQPGGLVDEKVLLARSLMPRRRPTPPWLLPVQAYKPSVLREYIEEARFRTRDLKASREKFEIRRRIEQAYREKHGVKESRRFSPASWDWPLDYFCGLRNLRDRLDDERTRQFRRRGNQHAPKPPKTSLSNAVSVDDFEVDEDELWGMFVEQEFLKFDRLADKLSRAEIGYLYLVPRTVLEEAEWQEDYLDSNKLLVFRNIVTTVDDDAMEVD